MTHILIASVHRIATGGSGEAIHLRRLAEALGEAGERVTVLDGPMDPGRTAGDPVAGLRELELGVDGLLRRSRPDVALLWGHRGEETAMARRLDQGGVPVVLEHPAADLPPVPETLRAAREVVVPSRFARDLFREETGRDAHPIEPCLRPCTCPPDASGPGQAPRAPFRLTFINPEPAKGLDVVMHLVWATMRGNLPFRFRFVEGRWGAADLARLGIHAADLPCLEVVPYRADACSLYAETDLVLAPSLWRESFGMVAREAVAHGVPVVASRVGGLPEAVGDGGVCLDPPVCTGRYRARMTADEIRTWLEAVIAGVRQERIPRPRLLTRGTDESVNAYRELLERAVAAMARIQRRTDS
jgi:glycosyltransferase involved in cell wall biosynthesis